MQVQFEIFRGTFISWKDLFDQAAKFASSLSPERLISICHSDYNGEGIVTVWYWSN